MSQSAYYYLDQVPAQAATGYTTTKTGQMVENVYAILGEGLKPQLFSTLHDINRFWTVLGGGRFLKPETVEALMASYRVQSQSPGFHRVEGKAPGVQVVFGGNLKKALSITVLSNGEEGASSIFDQLVSYS